MQKGVLRAIWMWRFLQMMVPDVLAMMCLFALLYVLVDCAESMIRVGRK
jgi:hypothetical protein